MIVAVLILESAMSQIAIPVNHSARIRAYAAKFPYLSPVELAKLTGDRPATVRAALQHLALGKANHPLSYNCALY